MGPKGIVGIDTGSPRGSCPRWSTCGKYGRSSILSPDGCGGSCNGTSGVPALASKDCSSIFRALVIQTEG